MPCQAYTNEQGKPITSVPWWFSERRFPNAYTYCGNSVGFSCPPSRERVFHEVDEAEARAVAYIRKSSFENLELIWISAIVSQIIIYMIGR